MTILQPRLLRTLLALAALAAACALLAAPAAHAARARAGRPRTTTCDVSGFAGTIASTTVTSLKVTGTSCGTGARVVRAFHACRLANGPSGRCVRLVQGFACGETRSGIPPVFSATTTCRKRRATVVSRYSQSV